MTFEEELKQVQQAISDILTNAQEASYNSQRVRKADIAVLQTREEFLIKQIKNEKRRGIKVRRAVPC